MTVRADGSALASTRADCQCTGTQIWQIAFAIVTAVGILPPGPRSRGVFHPAGASQRPGGDGGGAGQDGPHAGGGGLADGCDSEGTR